MTTNKIKFPTEQKVDFIKELRQNVKEYFKENNLSKYGNASIVVKSLFMLSLYATPYVLMLTGVLSSSLAILGAWIVMGVGMAGIGMALMHDANHGTFSKNPRLNKILGKSLYLLGGFPPTWRHQHNTLHHGFTNIEGHDEDIEPIGLLRFSPHKPVKKFHRFQHIYTWLLYGLMTLSWVTLKDFKRLKRYKNNNAYIGKKNNHGLLLTDLIISKIIYYAALVAVPIVFLPTPWYLTVLFFLAMHYVSGLILSSIFQTAHVMPSSKYPLPDKDGNIENNWAIHQLLTTSNYAPKSKIFSWLIGGLNYQVEHHLFPNISHVHYKKISKLVKETAQKYKLPYYTQPNFLVALRLHGRMMKYLGQGKIPVSN